MSSVGDLEELVLSFKCDSDIVDGVGLVEGEGEEDVPGGN